MGKGLRSRAFVVSMDLLKMKSENNKMLKLMLLQHISGMHEKHRQS
jgi:hypothetical protein